MSRLRRPDLPEGFGYVPGEQPPDEASWLKLNTNESPFPPSPRVAEVLAAAATELRRYPHPFAEPLRSALAARHGVAPEQVLLANGADQVLDCCFRAFARPGDTVVVTDPTYSLFPVLASVFSLTLETVALGEDGVPPSRFAQAESPLRLLVNPNSPTGTWLPPAEVERALDGAGGAVVIDEAYCDFAPESCVPALVHHPGWIVVRTFSKAHALAGLRVGYAVAAPDVIADLAAVKDSYPVDRLAIAAACAALDDEGHHRRIVETVRSERDRLTRTLRDAGWSVGDSQANYVLARPPHGEAAAVADELRQARILVRHFAGGAYADRLRITVGAPDENDRLLRALGLTGPAA